MYDVKELWKELKMEVNNANKPTAKQQSIFNHIEQRSLSGIVKLHLLYDDYTNTDKTKCSRDYFFDVVSTRWSVFREDGTVWVDLDSPLGDLWTQLESSFQTS